jgi:hypothetical protein
MGDRQSLQAADDPVTAVAPRARRGRPLPVGCSVADPRLQDDLNRAIAEGDLAMAQLALELGATIDGRDEDGRTALYWAVHDPEGLEHLRWLLRAGAHVAAEQPSDGHTSVHRAAAWGNGDALRLLLDADGRCALERFDYLGRTPLICAAARGHDELVDLLLEAGANINARDPARDGDSALRNAVFDKDERMVAFLLSRRADPTLPGCMGLSPLALANRWAESRHPELRRIHQLVAGAARHPDRRR